MAELLLPPPLALDARCRALAALAARLAALDLSPLLVYLVAVADEGVLPFLAEQFSLLGADGWALAESDLARRSLIRSAIELHRFKGTPWAIREVFRRLGFGEVSLIEGLAGRVRDGSIRRDGLFVHGDAASWACYRVVLLRPITNDQAAALRRVLEAFAPGRCCLASLEYRLAANRHNGAIHRDGQFNRGSA